MMFYSVCFLLALNVDQIAAARSALADGLPGVAIRKLESAGAVKSGTESSILLARAYVEDNRPEKAVEILKASPGGAESDFWLAQALAALGRSDQALSAYRAAQKAPEFYSQARLGEARMLRAAGRPQEALEILKSQQEWAGDLGALAGFETAEAFLDLKRAADARAVLDAMRPADSIGLARRDFLTARSLALSGDDAGAIRLFDALVPTDESMAVSAVLGQAEALIRIGQPSTAETLVEGFLSKNPDASELPGLFTVLDRLYSSQTPSTSNELKRWANDETSSSRKRLAAYYLAKSEARLGRDDRAERLLQVAAGDSDRDQTGQIAVLDLARLRLKQGRGSEALAILPPLTTSGEADYLRGLALAAGNQPAEAVGAFLSASASASLSESALFNASLCELLADGKSREAFELLKQKYPQSSKVNLVKIQEAFRLARLGDPGAVGILQELGAGTDTGIPCSAALALAEWKYQHDDKAGAGTELRRISTGDSTEASRADALSVFLADDGGDGEAAIKAAENFLATHAGSPSEAEVRMKLGELYFRKGDFAGARIQLESLAGKFPGSAQEMPALFLAAQAASRLQTPASANDAMILYEQVAAANGPLSLRARLEQAILQAALGKRSEAIVIFDSILSANPDPETRSAALMEKAKALLANADEASTTSALKVLAGIAGDTTLSPSWKNQALVRIGAAYETLGDTDAAVSSYYDVLKDSGSAEFFWFYKAGFAAARLLESAKRWDQAIRVYELISAANGPRSKEADARINKIRLENFLWESKPEN
ncbi:MAG: hypothetical protein D4R65_06395 [Verrucomicrobiaceae bacterium]|nr:MAG: hypothetical protein D4R65_06395 [Verrucomicrobiaceae bacterium]